MTITIHRNFGDSLSAAFPPSPDDLCVKAAADHFGRTLINQALSGAQAADMAALCWGVTPTDTEAYSVLTGYNDVYSFGSNTVKFGDGFIPCHLGNVAWLAMPAKVSARAMYDAGDKYGAWTDSGFNSGVGMHNSNPQVGDALACYVSGKLICIFGAIHNASTSEGTADVKIDGVTVGQIAMKGTQIGNTALGCNLTMGCWPFRVTTAGSHLVQVIATNTKTLFIDAIAGSDDQTTKPNVYVGDLSRRHPLVLMDPLTALYNSAILDNVHLLRSAGLNVRMAYMSKAIDPVEDIFDDDVHWNISGQQNAGAEMIRVLSL